MSTFAIVLFIVQACLILNCLAAIAPFGYGAGLAGPYGYGAGLAGPYGYGAGLAGPYGYGAGLAGAYGYGRAGYRGLLY